MEKLGVRERIIETASDLFYNQGYNQTGINQIIEQAGVAKASMYQHFRSKEDVAVAYLDERHRMWMEDLDRYVSNKNGALSKIAGIFDYLEEWLIDVNFRGCAWQNIITDIPLVQNKIKNHATFHKNELRKWVQEHLSLDNAYTKKKAKDMSGEVIVLIEGAIMLSQIQKNEWPIQAAKRTCKKILS